MSEHDCVQENTIGKMEATITRMEKELFNGNGGLVKAVPVLSDNVKSLAQSVGELRTGISAFLKFTTEHQAESAAVERLKASRMQSWKLISIVVGVIVSMTTIFGFILNVGTKNRVELLDLKMGFKQDRVPDSTVRSVRALPLDTTKLFKR